MSEWTIDNAWRAHLIFASMWHAWDAPVSSMKKALDFPKSAQTLHRILSGERWWDPGSLKRPLRAISCKHCTPHAGVLGFIENRADGIERLNWLHLAAGNFVHVKERDLDLLTDLLLHYHDELPRVVEFSADVPWELLPDRAIRPVVRSWVKALLELPYRRTREEITEVLVTCAKRLKRARALWEGPWPRHELWMAEGALKRASELLWPYDECDRDMIDELFCELAYVEIPQRGLKVNVYADWPPSLVHPNMHAPRSKPHHLEFYQRIKVHKGLGFLQLRGRVNGCYFPSPLEGNGGVLVRQFLHHLEALKLRLVHDDDEDSAQRYVLALLKDDRARVMIELRREHLEHMRAQAPARYRRRPSIRSYSGLKTH